jgi:hypothetical protein
MLLEKPSDFGEIITNWCRRQVFYYLTAIELLVEAGIENRHHTPIFTVADQPPSVMSAVFFGGG